MGFLTKYFFGTSVAFNYLVQGSKTVLVFEKVGLVVKKTEILSAIQVS